MMDRAICPRRKPEIGIMHSSMARAKEKSERDPDFEPDWENDCDVCGMAPVLPITGMCGPCTFGEADTIMGNW